MIAALRGRVIHISGNVLTVDVQGVGYEVHATTGCVSRCELNSEVFITVHTEVQETMIRLYGFNDELEKQVFFLLTRVKGVGAKSASDILSKVDKVKLLRTVAAGDVTALQTFKGIGKKTAERIVVELRDKVGEYVVEGRVSSLTVEKEIVTPATEAVQALMALGFQRKEAEAAVKRVEGNGGLLSDASGIVKEALRFI